MIRFNSQTAEFVLDESLCEKIYQRVQLGQSVRHISKKFKLSEYAVKKLADYWKDKDCSKSGELNG